MLRKKSNIFIVLLILTAIITSCSTKKNQWNRRVYHNITAHYNAYYNGNEALKQAQKSLIENQVDDYSKVLEIFQFGTKEQSNTYLPQFERAKKKASIVIHKHSMEFNEKEYVKWVYQSYMLIGKANFYAQEYMLAEQNFKYILVKYNNEDIKHDARMWMAICQIKQEKYEDARSNLMTLKNRISKDVASKELVRMLPMVFADLYLQQQLYSSAIGPLKLAIESNKKKKTKARLTFILAQVYQQMGDLNEASKLYRKTLKLNPEYIMDFNSRINIAKCFDGGDRDGKKVKELLMDMVDDSKNKEFLDQIYFTLAEVELKNKDIPKAVEYLELSVLNSVSNNKQKAFSALKLADIYFDQKNYENAQAYYDSTMMFIPKEYENYEKLEDRSQILNELVGNLIAIKTQDSLIRIASLPENERTKFINELIEIELEKERAEREAEAERMRNAQFMEQNRMETTRSVTQQGNQKWYFYNNTAMSFGFTEFKNKWGQRKLEDNWRISNKNSLKFLDDEELSENDTDTANTNSLTKKDKEYYLQGLPLSAEKLDSSRKIIEDAYFNCGLIYREKLLNYESSVESFEELLQKYDTTHYRPQVYYYLNKLYTKLNNSLQANAYKDKLQNEYPNSDFAKLVNDPEYYKTLEEKNNKAHKYYKATYQSYLDGDYQTTINNCALGKKEYRNNKEVSAKFALLHAFALMKTADTIYFLNALDKVVQDFPNSEQGILANEISLKIRSALRGENNQQQQNNTEENKSIYSINDRSTHMFVVLVNLKNEKVNDVKNEISNHNSQYFSTHGLNISSIPLTKDIVMVGVSNFDNKTTAMNYMKTIEANQPLYNLINKSKDNNFIISDANYTILYKTKKFEEYKKFFKENYK